MPGILGTKLRREREDIGLTQEALAKAVGLSSEFISLLELGKRMPSLDTLTTLANYFKKDASYFLKEKEEAFNVLLQEESLDKKARGELRKFKKFCEEYSNLEELTGCRLELAPLYTHTSAERMADEERSRLGFGNGPIRDVFSVLELNGLHIVRQPIPEKSKISGVFIYFEIEGAAFALVNSIQSLGQQIFTAAHEYCHFLKDRNIGPVIDNPDIFINEYVSLYHPREKFAQTFAFRFLVPPSKVKEIINKDLFKKKLNFADVLYLRNYFGVGTLAIIQVLKDLEFISPAKFEEFQKLASSTHGEAFFGKFSEEKELIKGKGGIILSSRFKRVALEAYQKKLITVEKLSELFNLDKEKLKSFLKVR